ncbi:MAG: sugar transferase [Cyclobacteriaceae bacterium]
MSTFITRIDQGGMYSVIKSILDRLVAAILMILGVFPVLLIGWVGSLIDRSSILFRQVRSGKSGKPFTLYKLRTMKEGKVTPFGRFLRRWSIDELPQLWNILKGDMSLVGPRPLLVEYDAHYSAAQKRRLEVKPGITGLSQVNGRNSIGWERRFELDVQYVEKQSFWLDCKILMKTVVQLFDKKSSDFHLNQLPKFSEQHKRND